MFHNVQTAVKVFKLQCLSGEFEISDCCPWSPTIAFKRRKLPLLVAGKSFTERLSQLILTDKRYCLPNRNF